MKITLTKSEKQFVNDTLVPFVKKVGYELFGATCDSSRLDKFQDVFCSGNDSNDGYEISVIEVASVFYGNQLIKAAEMVMPTLVMLKGFLMNLENITKIYSSLEQTSREFEDKLTEYGVARYQLGTLKGTVVLTRRSGTTDWVNKCHYSIEGRHPGLHLDTDTIIGCVVGDIMVYSTREEAITESDKLLDRDLSMAKKAPAKKSPAKKES